jgi:hypothetical protein
MKRIILILSVSLLLFTACNKKETVSSTEFQGIWEFENYYGYPFNDNYQPPGNGKIIVLQGGVFERRQHDTVLFRGKYFLKNKTDCSGERKIHFSTNETPYPADAYISIESGKLILNTPDCYADGGSARYRKIGTGG